MLFAGLQPLGTLMYAAVGHYVGLFNAIGFGAVVVGAVAVMVAVSPAFRDRFADAAVESRRGRRGAD
jgi:hypothetical protein